MIQYLVYGVVMIGAVAGYWWWTAGRHGASAVNVSLGLRADEQIRMTTSGQFRLELEAKDAAIAAVGMQRVGKNVTLTLTHGGELVMRPVNEEPLRFRPGQLRVTRAEENVEKRAGTNGQPDTADVYSLLAGANEYRLVLARSAAEEIKAWSGS